MRDGVGVVIAQRGFVLDDLAHGRLVAPFELQAQGDGSYYVGYPVERPKSARVTAFEEWIVGEALRMESRPPA